VIRPGMLYRVRALMLHTDGVLEREGLAWWYARKRRWAFQPDGYTGTLLIRPEHLVLGDLVGVFDDAL